MKKRDKSLRMKTKLNWVLQSIRNNQKEKRNNIKSKLTRTGCPIKLFKTADLPAPYPICGTPEKRKK
jgi:hypothetical protein